MSLEGGAFVKNGAGISRGGEDLENSAIRCHCCKTFFSDWAGIGWQTKEIDQVSIDCFLRDVSCLAVPQFHVLFSEFD